MSSPDAPPLEAAREQEDQPDTAKALSSCASPEDADEAVPLSRTLVVLGVLALLVGLGFGLYMSTWTLLR